MYKTNVYIAVVRANITGNKNDYSCLIGAYTSKLDFKTELQLRGWQVSCILSFNQFKEVIKDPMNFRNKYSDACLLYLTHRRAMCVKMYDNFINKHPQFKEES